MTGKTIAERALRSLGLAMTLAAPALPVLAQDAAPALMQPAQYAVASLRQDIIPGAYEILDDAEHGVVLVAANPSFEGPSTGQVWLLDRDDLAVRRRIQLPDGAFALAMDPELGRVYVGNTMAGKLSILDAASGMLTGAVQLGQKDGEGHEHTRMIAVDPGTHRVYVTSPSERGVLWIVDGERAELVKRVDDVGLWAAGLALDSGKGRVYVGGGGIEEIGVYDAASGERVGSFSTGDTKEPGKDASKHFFVNLALDAKGGRLFGADSNTGQIYVFGTADGKLLGKVATGLGTLDVAYNDSRDEIYVTSRGVSREEPLGSGKLVVIDGRTLAVKHELSLPVHPNSLEVSQDGKLLFVTVKAPHGDTHPDFRKDAVDSVLRFDLSRLD
jgi:DNA-binding beta-propeller fold protein YncE